MRAMQHDEGRSRKGLDLGARAYARETIGKASHPQLGKLQELLRQYPTNPYSLHLAALHSCRVAFQSPSCSHRKLS